MPAGAVEKTAEYEILNTRPITKVISAVPSPPYFQERLIEPKHTEMNTK
jgi:hypothetical protein